jgi:hypothetical protein
LLEKKLHINKSAQLTFMIPSCLTLWNAEIIVQWDLHPEEV